MCKIIHLYHLKFKMSKANQKLKIAEYGVQVASFYLGGVGSNCAESLLQVVGAAENVGKKQ